ncbi:hypothetical protein B0A55_01214 [Friedmanniomyces simplex]|uniref:Uncharacterized protein n=1 Tax=Friedmanniomyces simplex TaxID=329884 RepID=A0A4U0Y1K2_9PEZI|nr:hypothetical protein B0A55_01214 [Friedmanniomyces simplex]
MQRLRPFTIREAPTDEEYQTLFTKAIAFQTGEEAASLKDQYENWLEHCRGQRMMHLCHTPLNQIFFGRMNFLLYDDEESVTDFLQVQINNHNATLNDDQRAEFGDGIHMVLEQTAQILSHLSCFPNYTYGNLISATQPAIQQRTDEPLGNCCWRPGQEVDFEQKGWVTVEREREREREEAGGKVLWGDGGKYGES